MKIERKFRPDREIELFCAERDMRLAALKGFGRRTAAESRETSDLPTGVDEWRPRYGLGVDQPGWVPLDEHRRRRRTDRAKREMHRLRGAAGPSIDNILATRHDGRADRQHIEIETFSPSASAKTLELPACSCRIGASDRPRRVPSVSWQRRRGLAMVERAQLGVGLQR